MTSVIVTRLPVFVIWSGNVPGDAMKLFLKKINARLTKEQGIELEVVDRGKMEGVVTIFLVDHEDLLIDTFYNTIAEHFKCKEPALYKPVPIVFVGAPDLSNCGQLGQERSDIYVESLGKSFPSDPRINVLDCSIWTRYVSMEPDDFISNLKESLTRANGPLFKEPVALEYAELYGRLIINDRLIGLDNSNGQDAHNNYVVPFPFHSESRLRVKSASAMTEEEGRGLLEKLQGTHWRILIIDDKALKCERIKEVFREKGMVILEDGTKPMAGKINVTIEWVDKVEGKGNTANSKLKDQGQRYDIILLDFLLGKKEDGKREYGTAFFNVLNNLNFTNCSDDDFLETNWIMSVSSFYNTFLDELRDICPLLSNRWIVQRGGDPLTTPELFFYEFITLALFQLGKLWPAESWFRSIWEKYIKEFHEITIKENANTIEAESELKILSRNCLYLLQKAWTRYNTYNSFDRPGLIKSLLAKHPQLEEDFKNVYPLLRKLFDTIAFESRNNYRNAEMSYNDIISYYHTMTPEQQRHAASLKKYILKK